MRNTRALTRVLLIPGLAAVLILLILPITGVLKFSFEQPSITDFSAGGFSFDNYAHILTDAHLQGIIVRTFVTAVLTTLVSLVLALPISYYLSRCSERVKSFLTILLLFPLLAGNVVLSVGWVAILSPSGIVSQLLQQFGLLDGSLEIMRTLGVLVILMAMVNLPMIVLSMQGSVDQVGDSTERAAYSLGASRFKAYREVLLPQIMPGIVAGTSLAFVLTVNAYATPRLIGGTTIQLAAPEIYGLVTLDGNWPYGSAMAVIVVALSLTITGVYSWIASKSFDKWQKVKV